MNGIYNNPHKNFKYFIWLEVLILDQGTFI